MAADSTGPKARRKHKSDAVVSMSSSAAAAVADAADGAAAAAAAHAPGMDDRLAALKAERQALKRQLQQASREVKAQAGQGTTSSVVCHICAGCIETTSHQICTFILHISTFVWLKLL